jgi:type I restriction enzyme S subunit
MVHNINERILPEDAEGLPYVGLEHLDSESLKLRRWGTPDEVEAQKLRFYSGDLIFGKRRFYQRKLAVADFDGICSAHAMVLRAKEKVVLPEFLPFFMQSEIFFERAMGISVGSLSPTINWSTLKEQKFLLPPLDEQRYIAEILSAVEDAIESLIVVKEDLRQLYASLAVSEFHLSETSLDTIELGSVVEFQSGYPFSSKEFTEYGDRLLRCSNVGIDYLHWGEDYTKYWRSDRRHEVLDYVLHEGDIVIAMDRPFISEGFKVARVIKTDLPALLLQRVGRFRLTDKIDSEYLWAYLHSPTFRHHLIKNQQGMDLPHISRFDVESAPIILPDIAVQQIKALKFFETEKNTKLVETRILQTIRLKKSLFNKLLTALETTHV